MRRGVSSLSVRCFGVFAMDDERPVTSKVIAAFARHPTAATYVASMLAGYGELEYFWSQCLGAVLRDDNAALHMLFRVRGEKARLDIADAILAPRFGAVGLAGEYANALGAMHWCRRVRNQYAHSHWTREGGDLCIFSMEDAAKRTDDGSDPPISVRPLKLSLLSDQERYFLYTLRALKHLRAAYLLTTGQETGQSTSPPSAPPKAMPQPKMHSLEG
jgi:hypothetical protein